jgi:hypothetical protein
MSDAWAELQALKSRRRRLEERKKERQDILNSGLVQVPSKSIAIPSNVNIVPTPGQQSKF